MPIIGQLARSSPRVSQWHVVLGTLTVPLISHRPTRASLPKLGDQWVYQVDIAGLSAEQLGRLVGYVAKKFHLRPAAVKRDLEKARWVPILASDVTAVVA